LLPSISRGNRGSIVANGPNGCAEGKRVHFFSVLKKNNSAVADRPATCEKTRTNRWPAAREIKEEGPFLPDLEKRYWPWAIFHLREGEVTL